MTILRRSLFAWVFALAACTHAQPDPQASAQADAHLATFSTVLKGDQEVPPAATLGQGQLDAVLDRNTRQLRWKLRYSGLTGPALSGHFHGPAQPGSNAGVVLPLPSPLSSPAEGSAQLTEAQAADLLAGRWYVNLHTAAHPGGEIRGQLTLR